jgi:hypothetical protein
MFLLCKRVETREKGQPVYLVEDIISLLRHAAKTKSLLNILTSHTIGVLLNACYPIAQHPTLSHQKQSRQARPEPFQRAKNLKKNNHTAPGRNRTGAFASQPAVANVCAT